MTNIFSHTLKLKPLVWSYTILFCVATIGIATFPPIRVSVLDDDELRIAQTTRLSVSNSDQQRLDIALFGLCAASIFFLIAGYRGILRARKRWRIRTSSYTFRVIRAPPRIQGWSITHCYLTI